VAWAAGEPAVSRLEAARRAFNLFVAGGDAPDGTTFDPRPSDLIGLVVFSAVPETRCPLTFNHSVLRERVAELEPKYGVDAGTNIGDAIVEAVLRLDRVAGVERKVIILLSDGEHTQTTDGQDAGLRPREAAQLAANLKFPVYTIDAGGDLPATASPEAVAEREAGRQTLRAVAEMTGGRAFTATGGADMLAAFHEIDALERVPVESFQYRRYHEFYPWCAAAAVGLLLLAHALDRTHWRTVP
jgi:Ca-activated chloride channel family protein